MTQLRRLACLFAAMGAAGSTAFSADLRHLSLDDRIAAQKAIEQVYWNHRIWPKENPGPKPPLAFVMSDEAIRAKVEDYLKKSNALETWWQRPVAAEQLQAELDRMAKNTRDGAALRELFAAMGNDPLVIAETLGRQTLVDRLIRNWYASDTRFHGELKRKADAALASCATIDCMKSSSGAYHETTWRRRGGRAGATANGDGSPLTLDPDAWATRLAQLATTLGATAESIPTGRWSRVEETPAAFVVTAVLERREDAVTVATVEWPKRSFEAWWSVARGAVGSKIAQPYAGFTLPNTPLTSCTDDTWSPTRYEVPDPRRDHSAIWTGTEVIVWGGSSEVNLNTGGRYNPSTDTWTPTPITNAPSARVEHRAVWTGTEMIVWGGADTAPFVNSGGRYNPSSDSWAPTSTGPNVPLPRIQHTVVWTGTEMIVWGGRSFAPDFLGAGGRYDPASDTWSFTSTTNAPSARARHSAVWTGDEMIVWGGFNNAFLNTGGRYSPSTDTWAATWAGSNVPSARTEHTAVWTGTEMIIWGGDNGTLLNSGGRYAPSSDSWTETSTAANVPSARHEHTAVWTGTEMIVWGGLDFVFSVNTGGRYDPSSDSWTATSTGPNVPNARPAHTAVWTGTEMIVWGGDNGESTGGRYKPSTDSWTPTSTGVNVPAGHDNHSAVWTGTEMIVWGGYSMGPQNSGGRYVPSTDTWAATSTGTNVPTARAQHTAVWTGTEMIVWGGYGGPYLNSGGRYAPSSDSWTATSAGANVPAARYGHTAVWTGTQVIVWGGYDGSSSVNTGGRYTPSSDSWLTTSTGASAPASRSGHTAVWTGTEMIVWGGHDGSSYLNTGARYNASSDGWLTTSTGTNAPTPRSEHTAVWTGAEMIVWGGWTSGPENSGARYVPSTNAWTSTSMGANVPPPTSDHSAVWTGVEMIVWGGYDGARVNTGGRYHPASDSWTRTSTGTNVPTGRYYHTSVWTGTEMIVWGGVPSTTTGARYCVCPGGATFYRDADGDGYGVSADTVFACSLPAGYASIGGDCDDATVLVHPGAPEVNDGLENQCPGDPGFGVIDEISGGSGFLTPGNKTLFSWPAQLGATSYEVARSPYRDFHAGCVHSAAPTTSWSDPANPAPGAGFYYLVRAAAPRLGSWGQRRPVVERTVCGGCVSTGDWCDDGSVCTLANVCSGAVCTGTPLSCDDANSCTTDSCDPVSGCVHTNNTIACNDSNACTTFDACSGGSCVGGPALNCNDGNVCTNDSCNPVTGCAHVNNAAACDDGNVCTSGDVCSGGVCAGTLPTASSHLVISQIQVDGDGPSSTEDEFIEIYNPTASAISLSGKSLQYKTNAGSLTYFMHVFGGAASVPAHGWFLVARAGYNGAAAFDEENTAFPMGATVGSVFLVGDTVLRSGTACASLTNIIDKVGYGTGNCPEGSPVTAPTPNDSILRKPGGACGNGTDTDSNPADFMSQSPSTPRNSVSTPQP